MLVIVGPRKKSAPREEDALFLASNLLRSRSEVELDRELYDSAALLVRGVAEQRAGLLARGVEAERQVLPAIEGPQRMVQEVIAVDTELQFLRFGDLEVLKQSQVGVEEPRSIDGWQHRRPVLPDTRRLGETVPIDELVRRQVRRRVASEDRGQLQVGGSQQRGVAGGVTPNGGRVAKVEVVTGAEPGQVGTAFQLGDAGELPAIDESAQYLVGGVASQFDRVGGVEDVRAVGRLHSVIVGQVERIGIGVDYAHGLAVGIVEVDIVVALGAHPGYLHRIVVRIQVIGRQVGTVRVTRIRNKIV